MRLLKENLLVQFSVVSLIAMAVIAMVLAVILSNTIRSGAIDTLAEEAIAEIKASKATKAIPIVMLTGVGYELNKKLAKSMGASGYITKPFSPDELKAVVREALKQVRDD